MKLPSNAILALGLALVSPVAAANCKLSKPASVSSSSSSVPASSTSSVPSSSSSAAPSCTNVVQNGDFADGVVHWVLLGATTILNPCLSAAGCFDATVSSDYTTSFSQTVATAAGTTYTFNVYYYLVGGSGSITLSCTLLDTVSNVATTFAIPLSYSNTGNFVPYANTYTALSDSTGVICTMGSNGFAEIYFTGVSLQC